MKLSNWIRFNWDLTKLPQFDAALPEHYEIGAATAEDETELRKVISSAFVLDPAWNPATQEVVSRVPFATADEINAAVAAAKEAFKTWRNTPLAARARIMLKLQALIRENMGRIAQTLTAEQGKTLPDAEGDISRGGIGTSPFRHHPAAASSGR